MLPERTIAGTMSAYCQSSIQAVQLTRLRRNQLSIVLLLLGHLVVLQSLVEHRHTVLMLRVFFVLTSQAACVEQSRVHVESFNRMALDLHIGAKQAGMFVNVSPCQPPSTGLCALCGADGLEMVEGEQVCGTCGLLTRQEAATSWADVTRVQAPPRYSYDRTLQFKEHMTRLQGLGTVDEGLLRQIRGVLHGQPRLSKQEFFSRLKQITRQRAHFDQLHCLYYRCYERRPPDLSAVENQVLQDFDVYSTSFNRLQHGTGKPFTNNQHLLYNLLRRHGARVTRAELMVPPKATDPTMRRVFVSLGWRLAA